MSNLTAITPCLVCDRPMRVRELHNDDGKAFRVFDCEHCQIAHTVHDFTSLGASPSEALAGNTSPDCAGLCKGSGSFGP